MSSFAYRPSTEALGRFQGRLSENDLKATQYIPATDLPEIVKVALNEGCSLKIAFEYISEEKLLRQAILSNGAIVSRGERTGRVYRIDLQIPAKSTLSEVVAKIQETARLLAAGEEVIAQSPSSEVRTARQKVAASALSDFGQYADRWLNFAG